MPGPLPESVPARGGRVGRSGPGVGGAQLPVVLPGPLRGADPQGLPDQGLCPVLEGARGSRDRLDRQQLPPADLLGQLLTSHVHVGFHGPDPAQGAHILTLIIHQWWPLRSCVRIIFPQKNMPRAGPVVS